MLWIRSVLRSAISDNVNISNVSSESFGFSAVTCSPSAKRFGGVFAQELKVSTNNKGIINLLILVITACFLYK